MPTNCFIPKIFLSLIIIHRISDKPPLKLKLDALPCLCFQEQHIPVTTIRFVFFKRISNLFRLLSLRGPWHRLYKVLSSSWWSPFKLLTTNTSILSWTKTKRFLIRITNTINCSIITFATIFIKSTWNLKPSPQNFNSKQEQRNSNKGQVFLFPHFLGGQVKVCHLFLSK